MAKQKRVEEPANIQLNPAASPVNRFITPGGQAPTAPATSMAPAPPPTGPNANQQLASALTRYGDQLASFSPRLDVLQKGLEQAFNPMIQQRNEQAVAAGEAMVLESQKTMAQLVADGEIDVEESPWLIYGARKASGYLQAQAWERHVNLRYDEMITKDPAMTELQWDKAYREMHAEYISSNKMTDPLEVQVFTSSARASKQRTDAKHVSHAAKHRKNLLNQETMTSISSLASTVKERRDEMSLDPNESFVIPQDSEGNLGVNPDRVMENRGAVLPPEESVGRQERSMALLENTMVELESIIRKRAEVFGLSGHPDSALNVVGSEIAKRLSDPETYDPVLEQAFLNLTNPDGTKLVSGGIWKAFEESSRGARKTASITLTKQNNRDIAGWMGANLEGGRDEFIEWAESNVSSHPLVLEGLEQQYWKLRTQYNGWGQIDADEKYRAESYFANIENPPVSYDTWISEEYAPVLDVIAGNDKVFRRTLEEKAWFDAYESRYWDGGRDPEQRAARHEWERQNIAKFVRTGRPPLTTQEISDALEGFGFPKGSKKWNQLFDKYAQEFNDPRFIREGKINKGDRAAMFDLIEREYEQGHSMGTELRMVGEGDNAKEMHVSVQAPPKTVMTRTQVNDLIRLRFPNLSVEQHESMAQTLYNYQLNLIPNAPSLGPLHRESVKSTVDEIYTQVSANGGNEADFYKRTREVYHDNYIYENASYDVKASADGKIELEGPHSATIDTRKVWEQHQTKKSEMKFAPYADNSLLQRLMETKGNPTERQELLSDYPDLADINDSSIVTITQGFNRVRAEMAAEAVTSTGQVPPIIAANTRVFSQSIDLYQSADPTEREDLRLYAEMVDTMASSKNEDEVALAKEKRDELLGKYPSTSKFRSMVGVLESFAQAQELYISGRNRQRPDMFFEGEAAEVLEATLAIGLESDLYPQQSGQTRFGTLKMANSSLAMFNIGGRPDVEVPPVRLAASSGDTTTQGAVWIQEGTGRQEVINRLQYLAGFRTDTANERQQADWVEKNIDNVATRVAITGRTPFWIMNNIAGKNIPTPSVANVSYSSEVAAITRYNPALANITYKDLYTSAATNLHRDAGDTAFRQLVKKRGIPGDISKMSFMIVPVADTLPYGTNPRSFNIYSVDKNGARGVIYADRISIDELWGAHVIDSSPKALENILKVQKRFGGILSDLNEGGDIMQLKRVFAEADAKLDFVSYWSNLDRIEQRDWMPYLDDNAKSTLGITE